MNAVRSNLIIPMLQINFKFSQLKRFANRNSTFYAVQKFHHSTFHASNKLQQIRTNGMIANEKPNKHRIQLVKKKKRKRKGKNVEKFRKPHSRIRVEAHASHFDLYHRFPFQLPNTIRTDSASTHET